MVNYGANAIINYREFGGYIMIGRSIAQAAGVIGLLALVPLFYIHFIRRGGSIDENTKG